ncbi:hypothetical protein GN244_ATG12808 [Phytophthora infestans]|uniref:Uncharacterized protein n=1 Tax=Phytophthora infestans TaxID=4787 RepID=A0A833SIL4_PHYIN|nr:hypothetical protein GN244_ATG12808 [Phytophthora infestans]KAF4134797.1 hypothetical protein GN958_ATG16053 [Phytophthora infestans]
MLIEQLAQAVPQLYSLSETVYSNKVMPSFGCRMESSVDESRGRIIELVARVPADCSMKQVSDILWQDVKNLSRSPDKSYRYMNERGPDAVAKSFDLAIRCPGDTTASHGIEYLRKFEEKDRIVHIRQTKLLLPEGRQEGSFLAVKDVKSIQTEMLNTWAMKLRSDWQWQQELVAGNLAPTLPL